MKTGQRAAARYDQENEMCALLILADREAFGGPESLMVRWARLVVEKSLPTVRGPLFRQRAA